MANGGTQTPFLDRALANMSEREKRLVGLLAGTFVVLVLGGGMWWASSKLDGMERRVKEMRGTLAQIEALESQYKSAENTERQAEMRLRTNNTSLFSLLQKSAGQLGLTLNDLQERKQPVKGNDAITEVSVEVNLKQVSIDKLNTFLEKIEGKSSKGLVKVLKLKVKTRFDDAELLDVSMTVSTWKTS
jgi:CHASE3 domain sensor protein